MWRGFAGKNPWPAALYFTHFSAGRRKAHLLGRFGRGGPSGLPHLSLLVLRGSCLQEVLLFPALHFTQSGAQMGWQLLFTSAHDFVDRINLHMK